jgi:hypothetical protein
VKENVWFDQVTEKNWIFQLTNFFSLKRLVSGKTQFFSMTWSNQMFSFTVQLVLDVIYLSQKKILSHSKIFLLGTTHVNGHDSCHTLLTNRYRPTTSKLWRRDSKFEKSDSKVEEGISNMKKERFQSRRFYQRRFTIPKFGIMANPEKKIHRLITKFLYSATKLPIFEI